MNGISGIGGSASGRFPDRRYQRGEASGKTGKPPSKKPEKPAPDQPEPTVKLDLSDAGKFLAEIQNLSLEQIQHLLAEPETQRMIQQRTAQEQRNIYQAIQATLEKKAEL